MLCQDGIGQANSTSCLGPNTSGYCSRHRYKCHGWTPDHCCRPCMLVRRHQRWNHQYWSPFLMNSGQSLSLWSSCPQIRSVFYAKIHCLLPACWQVRTRPLQLQRRTLVESVKIVWDQSWWSQGCFPCTNMPRRRWSEIGLGHLPGYIEWYPATTNDIQPLPNAFGPCAQRCDVQFTWTVPPWSRILREDCFPL